MIEEGISLEILNNIQDGVYYVDKNRVIQFWNKGAEKITGYKAEEVVGLTCPETYLNHIDEECRRSNIKKAGYYGYAY